MKKPNNFSLEKVSLFDEEAVEGWKWISPTGDEFFMVGSWDEEPSFPEEFLTEENYEK